MGIVVVVAALVVGAIPAGVLAVAEPAATQLQLLVMLFGFAISFAVVALWVRLRERRPLATLGFTAPPATATRNVLRGAGIGLGMIALCVLLPVVLGQASLEWTGSQIGGGGLAFIAVMLLAFVVQGSTEEVVTRGFLTQVVARRWGLGAAIIVQAVVFAAVHGANPGIGVLPVVNLLLVAFLLSFWSISEGGLWGVCAFHAVWNWSQGFVFGVPVSGMEVGGSLFTFTASASGHPLISGGAFGIEGGLLTMIVLMAAVVIAYRAFALRNRVRELSPVA